MPLPDAMSARLAEHRTAGEKLAEGLRKRRRVLIDEIAEVEHALEDLGFPIPRPEALAPPVRTRKPTHSPVQDALLALLARGPLGVKVIAEGLGRTLAQTRTILKDKSAAGVVRRVSHGVYGLPDPAPPDSAT